MISVGVASPEAAVSFEIRPLKNSRNDRAVITGRFEDANNVSIKLRKPYTLKQQRSARVCTRVRAVELFFIGKRTGSSFVIFLTKWGMREAATSQAGLLTLRDPSQLLQQALSFSSSTLTTRSTAPLSTRLQQLLFRTHRAI